MGPSFGGESTIPIWHFVRLVILDQRGYAVDLTPVVPAELPEDAIRRGSLEVKYDGDLRRIDVADMGILQTARMEPVRMSKAYKDRPNYAGYYWAATTERHHWFESLYEKLALTALDRDPDVVGMVTQPFEIIWASPRKSHFPDILVERADRSRVLVDVRPRGRIRPKDAETFARTSALCELLEVEYRLFADLTQVEVLNLRFLAGYRYARWRCPDPIAAALATHAGEVRTLREWLPSLEGTEFPSRGLLLAALWHGALAVDLSVRLEMDREGVCTGRGW